MQCAEACDGRQAPRGVDDAAAAADNSSAAERRHSFTATRSNMATSADARIRSRADLQQYLDHFNRKEYERQIEYYAPDVVYKVGTLTLTSPRAIAEFYADFHQYCREHVEIAQFALDGDVCAVVMPSRFEPFRTYQRHGLNFETGKTVEFVSFIFYTLRGGKIWRIRVGRYPGSAEDFKSGEAR
jgi:ketosteroid isomerase-like protein